MGFFDKAKEFLQETASDFNEGVDAKKEKIVRESRKYERYSVDELKEMLKTASGDKKYAIKYVLKKKM